MILIFEGTIGWVTPDTIVAFAAKAQAEPSFQAVSS